MYGSATGNAEHIAKSLAAQRPSAVCCELNQFKRKCDWKTEGPHGVLVVTSTTGNGDPPENAGRFVRHVKKCTDPMFANCVFAVLGLGDTNYDQFCACGKLIDRKMAELGGKRICPIACADEGTGLEDVVEPWTERILQQIELAMNGGGSVKEEDETKENVIANEVDKENAVSIPSANSSKVPSEGVSMIQALLKREGHTMDDLTSIVDPATLPRHACAISKCELVDPSPQVDDDASVSSTSSGVVYTAHHPFASSIVGARYLTNTATSASSKANGLALEQVYDVYNEAFSLDGPEGEKNGKRVIELSLSLPDDSSMKYQPGDSIGLCAPNQPNAVDFVLNMLHQHHGLQASQCIAIDESHAITIRHAIEHKVDLSGPVPKMSKFIFHSMVKLAKDPQDQACLHLLSSKSEIGDLLSTILCDEQKYTAVDFLKLFPSLQQMTLSDLISTFPPLPPRYYSVSSSSLDSVIKVAFAVVDYQTTSLLLNGTQRGQRRIRGVATGWLEALASSFLDGQQSVESCNVPIFPKQSPDFRMPPNPNAKLILIGPGTGIAPFVGFLREKQDRMASTECPNQGSVGSIDVFFGCRHQDHDWIYRDEMRAFAESSVVTNVFNAFSRDTDSSHRYVQHLMEENAERLVSLVLDDEASIYLCGDGNAMAKDVQSKLLSLLAARPGTDAEDYLEQMKREKRFVLDIWS